MVNSSGSGRLERPSAAPPDLRRRIAAAVDILARREVAAASFDGLRAQYSMLAAAYRELRSEHEQLLTDLRGTRAELRVAVRSYARELRTTGLPADELGIALQGVIDEILHTVPDGVADVLSRDIQSWGAEVYGE